MNPIFQTGFFDSILNSQRAAMKCFSAILTIVFLSSFLTACGSGGSGEAETSVDGATDTQVSSSQEQIQTGVFVDAFHIGHGLSKVLQTSRVNSNTLKEKWSPSRLVVLHWVQFMVPR